MTSAQPADDDARREARRGIAKWLLAALSECPDQAFSLAELRRAVWPHVPAAVRGSPAILWVGDELSRTLNRLKKQGQVTKDEARGGWRH